MCAAFCLCLPLLPYKPDAYLVLLSGVLVLTLIGIYDDVCEVNPTKRFLLHCGVVLYVVLEGSIRIDHLGDLFNRGSDTPLDESAIPLTLLGMVGIINAFNMIDGLDGLAGGLALITTGYLLALDLAAPLPDFSAAGTLLILMMVIAGFLCFNLRHPWRNCASVFMGDGGSTMLGFILAWFLVGLSQDHASQAAVLMPITAAWIVAIPLVDAVAVMVRRLFHGQNPFGADRQHLHHLLLNFGYADGQVTAMLLVGAITTGAVGVVAYGLNVPEFVQFYGFIGVFLLYFGVTTWFWRRRTSAPTA